MSTEAPIKSRIQAYFAEATKVDIARIAGLHDQSSLKNFRDTTWNPTLKVVENLLAVIPDDWSIGDPVDLNAIKKAAENAQRRGQKKTEQKKKRRAA